MLNVSGSEYPFLKAIRQRIELAANAVNTKVTSNSFFILLRMRYKLTPTFDAQQDWTSGLWRATFSVHSIV